MRFKMIYWTPMTSMSGSYFLYFGKLWKILEERPFFRADMAGLGKYHTGGYGRIGVYRDKQVGANTRNRISP